jgi:hypothetical protein
MRHLIVLTAIALTSGFSSVHAGQESKTDLKNLAEQVVSDDPAVVAAAIKTLRSAGSDGLQALFATWEPYVRKHIANPMRNVRSWQQISTALDNVGAQHDCYTSRLYWYTDLNAAVAAARQQGGKPILSLRLLGNLTDELSCANSRFFRSILYANEKISDKLRERYILHWKSVRPVPKVTIDFGDGRKIECTVTGNSIHYILDADGRPIEAIPGLYGPQAFLRELERGEEIVKESAALPGPERSKFLQDYHFRRAASIRAAWRDDLQQLGIRPPEPDYSRRSQLSAAANPIWTPELAEVTTDQVWGRIAALHATDAVLDKNSVALIQAQKPNAARAGLGYVAKGSTETPLLRLIRNFQSSVAIDTVRSEYLFHGQIHTWLAEEGNSAEVASLNDRVYRVLFLTPSDDPWLGLLPADTYSAIENGGVTQPAAK